MRILVTGGVRSGKSTHAEALVGDEPATYVAPGPTPDAEADPDDREERTEGARGDGTPRESREPHGSYSPTLASRVISCAAE